MSTEIDNLTLSNKITTLELNLTKLNQNIQMLHMNHQEFLNINQTNLAITRNEIEKLQTQNRLFFEWQKVIDNEMRKVTNAIQMLQQYKIDIDNMTRDLQKHALLLDQFTTDHSLSKETYANEQSFVKEEIQQIKDKLHEVKDFMIEENATIGSLWHDQNSKIELLQTSLSNLQKSTEEKETNYAKLIFDVRTATQLSSEASEKLEAQERQIKELSDSLKQFKFHFEVYEDNQARNSGSSSTPGKYYCNSQNN